MKRKYCTISGSGSQEQPMSSHCWLC
uniref:Uncharacterized protein n=1 Tax=Anguilla anguilla TaxID=7936 RepID=A0A0E9PD76_ANGAN